MLMGMDQSHHSNPRLANATALPNALNAPATGQVVRFLLDLFGSMPLTRIASTAKGSPLDAVGGDNYR
jgi:hypothetical protein